MAYTQTTKDDARKKYAVEQMSLAMVSETSGVPYQTVQRWKKQALEAGDDWDKVRAAYLMSDGSVEEGAKRLLPKLMLLFDTVAEQVEDDKIDVEAKGKLIASLMDSFHKAVSANKNLMPKTSELAVGMKVLRLFKEYIATNHPELKDDFHEILLPFGRYMQKELK